VFIVVYFVIDSVRKVLDTPSYYRLCVFKTENFKIHIVRHITSGNMYLKHTDVKAV